MEFTNNKALGGGEDGVGISLMSFGKDLQAQAYGGHGHGFAGANSFNFAVLNQYKDASGMAQGDYGSRQGDLYLPSANEFVAGQSTFVHFARGTNVYTMDAGPPAQAQSFLSARTFGGSVSGNYRTELVAPGVDYTVFDNKYCVTLENGAPTATQKPARATKPNAFTVDDCADFCTTNIDFCKSALYVAASQSCLLYERLDECTPAYPGFVDYPQASDGAQMLLVSWPHAMGEWPPIMPPPRCAAGAPPAAARRRRRRPTRRRPVGFSRWFEENFATGKP